jgi:glutamate formiminotransferase
MLIECVPNFSEGHDLAKVEAIAQTVAAVPDVLLLGWEADPDHHRSVVTFTGPPESVVEAAVQAAGRAAELIDLNRHQGVHPRVGAADVIPFVPLENVSMAQCVTFAYRAGREIWDRFGVPVYFYEAAARSANRARLERVRRPGFDGHPPDLGDIPAHPTAGASVVGARDFLIAFNINLSTDDDSIARAIARTVRESSGGFRFVKAIGLPLPSRGLTQVSLNLTNFARIPLRDLYRAIEQEARQHRTAVHSSQLVGFVPRRAFEMAPEIYEKAANFKPSRILEERIAELGKLK